jgi:hypothetical protein
MLSALGLALMLSGAGVIASRCWLGLQAETARKLKAVAERKRDERARALPSLKSRREAEPPSYGQSEARAATGTESAEQAAAAQGMSFGLMLELMQAQRNGFRAYLQQTGAENVTWLLRRGRWVRENEQ